MSAGDEALRNATGLVHGWTDVAVPWMARSDAHATAQDVPSVECAKDGIAFDQKAQRFCGFSCITKRIAMEHDSLRYDSLRWRVSPKP